MSERETKLGIPTIIIEGVSYPQQPDGSWVIGNQVFPPTKTPLWQRPGYRVGETSLGSSGTSKPEPDQS